MYTKVVAVFADPAETKEGGILSHYFTDDALVHTGNHFIILTNVYLITSQFSGWFPGPLSLGYSSSY